MTLDESAHDEDVLDEGFGIKIVTDKKLSPYLEGAIVDYIESRYGGGFEIRTPNSGGGCDDGCSC